MKAANCPSCGARVHFFSGASVFAVCEYCASTLTRKGEVLESIGKMAALQDDPTLIQIGTEGVYKGVHFGVIGRIQLNYGAGGGDGLWNEWHVMFDDMRSGWLGEASGEFTLTFEKSLPLQPPPHAGIHAEDRIDLGGAEFEVTNIESATCIAGQGELPFAVGPGYSAPVVDLRRDEQFATIDYSDDPPRVYVGERVDGGALKLYNLRDAASLPAKTVAADAFACPQCAAPFKLSSGRISTYGCASCGAVLDTTLSTVRVVLKAQEEANVALAIPLGAKGRFESIDWEVIGHMRRGARSETGPSGFSWSEFLLFDPKAGFRWLTTSSGHWSFVNNAAKSVKVKGTSAQQAGRAHEHFESYQSEVLHVLGEFYWRVKVGDTATVDDYIAPPVMISREKTGKEVTWSIATYMTPEEIAAAFKLDKPLPRPAGIAPNQPSPWDTTASALWKRFALFTVIALVVQLYFAFSSSTVYSDTFTIKHGADKSMTTRPFTVKGKDTNLVVRAQTDLDNTWAGLTYTLADPDSGRTWQVERQMEHYKGVDEDGDSWSEGSPGDDAVFYDIPPGKYVLNVEGELDPQSNRALVGNLTIERGHASWLNWLLLQLFLFSVPLVGWWRSRSFEARRWADSDHPRGGDKDDDD